MHYSIVINYGNTVFCYEHICRCYEVLYVPVKRFCVCVVRIFEECQVNYLAILPGSRKTVVYTNLYVVQINVISILV